MEMSCSRVRNFPKSLGLKTSLLCAHFTVSLSHLLSCHCYNERCPSQDRSVKTQPVFTFKAFSVTNIFSQNTTPCNCWTHVTAENWEHRDVSRDYFNSQPKKSLQILRRNSDSRFPPWPSFPLTSCLQGPKRRVWRRSGGFPTGPRSPSLHLQNLGPLFPNA